MSTYRIVMCCTTVAAIVANAVAGSSELPSLFVSAVLGAHAAHFWLNE